MRLFNVLISRLILGSDIVLTAYPPINFFNNIIFSRSAFFGTMPFFFYFDFIETPLPRFILRTKGGLLRVFGTMRQRRQLLKKNDFFFRFTFLRCFWLSKMLYMVKKNNWTEQKTDFVSDVHFIAFFES